MSDDEVVLDQLEGIGVEVVLGLGTPVGLGLVKGFLIDFLLELLGHSRALEDAVLAVRKESLNGVLSDGEGEDECLPRDGG